MNEKRFYLVHPYLQPHRRLPGSRGSGQRAPHCREAMGETVESEEPPDARELVAARSSLRTQPKRVYEFDKYHRRKKIIPFFCLQKSMNFSMFSCTE